MFTIVKSGGGTGNHLLIQFGILTLIEELHLNKDKIVTIMDIKSDLKIVIFYFFFSMRSSTRR